MADIDGAKARREIRREVEERTTLFMSWLKPRLGEQAQPTKNFKGKVKTRTLHTPKGFGTVAGFSCALGEVRCRADQSANRRGPWLSRNT